VPATPRADPARTRAAALPPDERRAAIVSVTVPLLLEHGPAVTTRQIAEAAGIAEGTIFRVFADKETLVWAAIESAFEARPLVAALDAIDRAAPLEQRLTDAVVILQRRMLDVWRLLSAVELSRVPDDRRELIDRHGPPTIAAITALFEPDRAALRLDPQAAAHALKRITLASSHPAIVADDGLSPAEIVTLLLDGIRLHTDTYMPANRHDQADTRPAPTDAPQDHPC